MRPVVHCHVAVVFGRQQACTLRWHEALRNAPPCVLIKSVIKSAVEPHAWAWHACRHDTRSRCRQAWQPRALSGATPSACIVCTSSARLGARVFMAASRHMTSSLTHIVQQPVTVAARASKRPACMHMPLAAQALGARSTLQLFNVHGRGLNRHYCIGGIGNPGRYPADLQRRMPRPWCWLGADCGGGGAWSGDAASNTHQGRRRMCAQTA